MRMGPWSSSHDEVRYCSLDCHKRDWDVHRTWCRCSASGKVLVQQLPRTKVICEGDRPAINRVQEVD